MNNAAIKKSGKRDFLILVMLVVAFIAVVFIYLFINYTEQNISLQTQSNETIGVAYDVKGKVLYRDSQSLDWFEMGHDSPIHSKQFLFTNEESRAEYVFLDDSIVIQNSDTLLFVNSKFDLLGTLYQRETGKKAKISKGASSLEMELVEGEVLVSMSKTGKLRSIKTNLGTIAPETEEFSEFIVVNKKGELSVDVIKGQVNVTDAKVNKSIMERESYNRKKGGSEKLGSVSDQKVEKYRDYQAKASRKSEGKVQERKGFEEFLKEIMGIFLPFLN
jgi:hypothetical protein